MRTQKAFLQEIKDLLEKNGAGHLFKALKEVFYKYIERILDRSARMWPLRRGRQDVDTIQGHQDGEVRSWPPGRSCQDLVTRKWPPGRGHQDMVTRKGLPGRGHYGSTSKWLTGCGHLKQSFSLVISIIGKDLQYCSKKDYISS